jgi:hypothetical protein
MTNESKSEPAAEKRTVDQKLDKALEQSFPGSDPISISQPGSDHKPRKSS